MRPWWIEIIGSDPCEWIAESDEPAAKWIVLKHVLGRSDDDPGVGQARAIVEVLIRFGRADSPRVVAGITRMGEDITSTRQGTAWRCVPISPSGFRGPGRKDDFCPQVTLEALRAYSWVPEGRRPANLLDAARTCVRAWLNRSTEQPYMFGHGYRFKTVKWPPFWYDVGWVLDTLGRCPDLWRGDHSRDEDRRAIAEMAAGMIAYNFGPGGLVTPRSCYLGFSGFSFGQKKRPSPFATARLISILHRLRDLEGDIASVDVLSLGSSKGGSGVPRPPKRAP